MSPDSEAGPVGRQVTIRVVLPEELPTLHSNHMNIMQVNDEFYLIFSEAVLPVASSPSDMEDIREVAAIAVAKIVVSPRMLESTIAALQRVFDKYKAMSGKQESDR